MAYVFIRTEIGTEKEVAEELRKIEQGGARLTSYLIEPIAPYDIICEIRSKQEMSKKKSLKL